MHASPWHIVVLAVPGRPKLYQPQHLTLPSIKIAQELRYPALTAMAADTPGGLATSRNKVMCAFAKLVNSTEDYRLSSCFKFLNQNIAHDLFYFIDDSQSHARAINILFRMHKFAFVSDLLMLVMKFTRLITVQIHDFSPCSNSVSFRCYRILFHLTRRSNVSHIFSSNIPPRLCSPRVHLVRDLQL